MLIIVFNCANRGNPTGGEKDILPPKITKAEPANLSTNFSAKEIKIYFNEYIKVKDLDKQLIISPPMKTEPEITPLGSSSKYIKIKIYDTLTPNTTYSFNFGNSIVDNNEENPFPFFKYVVSTGNYIDSLKVHGAISDAFDRIPEQNVIVNLYEIDSTYTDSIVYKSKPKYMTNIGDSTTTFTIENIKTGTYKLVAIKDENRDIKFQQKTDKIGFVKDFITVTNDSVFYDIKLFKEKIDDKSLKPRYTAGQNIAFGFEGDYTNFKIENLSKLSSDFESKTIKANGIDTLNYFFKPKLKEKDSLIFKVTNKKSIDTFTIKLRNYKRDTLTIKDLNKGKIALDGDFKITANLPLTAINNNLITILDKDSTTVKFTSEYKALENTYIFKFNKTENNRYNFSMLPETFTDFFGNTSDSLNFKVNTPKLASLGDGSRIILKNAIYPLFVQLVTKDGDIVRDTYVEEKGNIDFKYLEPGKYFLRVLFDTNKNGVYDAGNYLKQEQPEHVSYYPKEIEVRTGFTDVTEFILKDIN